MGKIRRQFSEEIKRHAVDDFVSGRRSAADIAAELGLAQGVVYRWRVQLEEKAREGRIDELGTEGHHPHDAMRIQRLEEELAEYKRKVGEEKTNVAEKTNVTEQFRTVCPEKKQM